MAIIKYTRNVLTFLLLWLQYGTLFLSDCDYLVGSPTALAEAEVEASLRAVQGKGGLYLPAGALWGASDIRKMADLGTLKVSTANEVYHSSSLQTCISFG